MDAPSPPVTMKAPNGGASNGRFSVCPELFVLVLTNNFIWFLRPCNHNIRILYRKTVRVRHNIHLQISLCHNFLAQLNIVLFYVADARMMHSYTYFRPLNAEFKTSKVFQKIFLRISNASITASCNISDVNIVIVPADGSSAE